MVKKIASWITIVSIVLCIGSVGLLSGRIFFTRAGNAESAEKTYNTLSRQAAAAYLAQENFSSPIFTSTMQNFFRSTVGLKAIVILSRENKIEYYLSDSPGYLKVLPADASFSINNRDYGINAFTEKLFTAPLTIPNHEGFYLDCIYEIINRSDLFPIFRDTLIILTFLFLFTLIVLIAVYVPRGKRPHRTKQVVSERKPLPVAGKDVTRSSRNNTSGAGTSVPKKKLFSPVSGLCWQDLFEDRLNFELRRSASFDQDLMIALVFLKSKRIDQKLYNAISKILIDSFQFQDLLFEYGKKGFAIVIPNTDIDEGIKEMEKFIKKVVDKKTDIILAVGLSSRNGRLLTGKRLIDETRTALGKAYKETRHSMIAFRPDPVKYRDYISSKK